MPVKVLNREQTVGTPAAGSTDGDGERRWYAVWTRARHEKKVRDRLTARGMETLLPPWRCKTRWKDRWKVIELPLFPGYCLARFTPAERLRVLQTPGVVDIVRHQGEIDPIPPSELAVIQTIVSGRLFYLPHPFLEAGAEVEITHGPLMGARGILTRRDNPARVVIGLTLVRQAVVVEIDAADVTPL
ncbi:MAG: transcription termination/antitermination NusG family protein [Patescibacteria group bacterium]